MEIRIVLDRDGSVDEHSVSVTRRPPGREELPQDYNIVSVMLAAGATFDPALLTRNFYATSSCGVCGKASLEAIEIRGCAPLPAGGLNVPSEVLLAIADVPDTTTPPRWVRLSFDGRQSRS